ncbi:MAG: NUDIX domain-containing protein [Firmicutes bacterium]|nr:NUDIX domain-containing protein [Bacillota bacterium]
MNEYKRMRDYTHEEFINIISNMTEEELLEFSANYGGYPVLFRMSLDERVCHIPFIQTGSAIIIENENKEILLQERTDRNMWGLPGGCQDLGEQLEETAIREAKEETGLNLNKEDLVLIDTLSGNLRKNSYPNGDIVYNNTSLYLVKVLTKDTTNMKGDSETKRLKFFKPTELPDNIMDKDLINSYLRYISK